MDAAGALVGLKVYEGNAKITFSSNEKNGLSVEIETARLFMRSVQDTEKDIQLYASLYGNPEVMKMYATGEIKDKAYVAERIKTVWADRWHKHDPYSAFVIFTKDRQQFLGSIVLGHGDHPGESEVVGMGNPDFWNHGYGSEAAEAVVKEYAPATVKEGYALEGETLKRVVATCRTDNVGSERVLQKLGMQWVKQEEKYGAMRQVYSLELNANQAAASKKVEKTWWCTLL